jgi:hypothetical protein
MTLVRLGTHKPRALRMTILMPALLALQACTIQRYVYMDFAENTALKVIETKSPTNSNMWLVGSIPTRLILQDGPREILFSVDPDGHAPNVTISPAEGQGEALLEIDPDGEAANHCVAPRKLDVGVNVVLNSEKCSGKLRIKYFSSRNEKPIEYTIQYRVKSSGYMRIWDGL